MAGTVAGGKKAAAKNLQNNPNFYRDIGRIGGRNGNTGGFAANPQLARIAGARGGADQPSPIKKSNHRQSR